MNTCNTGNDCNDFDNFNVLDMILIDMILNDLDMIFFNVFDSIVCVFFGMYLDVL